MTHDKTTRIEALDAARGIVKKHGRARWFRGTKLFRHDGGFGIQLQCFPEPQGDEFFHEDFAPVRIDVIEMADMRLA